MSQGVLKRLENGQFKGQITTRALNEKFALYENPAKTAPTSSDKTPDFIVMAESPIHGEAYQAGVAWKYLGKQAHNQGQMILTLVFEDPSFGPKPIYFNAYPKNAAEWEIRFDRGDRSTQPAQAA